MLCPECYLGLYNECTNPQGRNGDIPCGREDLIALDSNSPSQSPTQADREAQLLQSDKVIDPALSEDKYAGKIASRDKKTEWDPEDGEEINVSKGTGRKLKPNSRLRNPARTGRSRANSVKPIKPGDICEWSQLKSAGGGLVPITGCLNNAAVTVHHGPDKDWLNNEPENLHKICDDCHKAYHKFNDPFYVWVRPEPGTPFFFRDEFKDQLTKHDPVTKATKAEILKNIMDREDIEVGDLDNEE